MHRLATMTLVVLTLSSGAAADDNATVPGDVTTPHPTILNLAVEWKIAGDANLNGTVSVRYRAVGRECLARGHASAAGPGRPEPPHDSHLPLGE